MESDFIDSRYELVQELGRGGVGAVWLALQHPLKRQVALKLMRGEYSDLPHLRRRFAREARSASRLSHENIAAVYDFGTEPGGQMYLVMELIAGPSLRSKVIEGASLFQILLIADQLLSALAHAHSRGVVHRDLKPENVLLAPPQPGEFSQPKIVDFGIATNVFDPVDARDTNHGEVVGTPLYMSPEQAAGDRNLSPRTDLYNLGVILYELVSGQHPFGFVAGLEAMRMHIHEEPPLLRPRAGLVLPDELGELIMQALAKDANQRLLSAVRMREALAPWLALAHANPEMRKVPEGLSTASAAFSLLEGSEIEPEPEHSEIVHQHRLRRPSFTGRQRERELLLGAVERSTRLGEGSLVMLEGGPGIGKTSLAIWLKERVEEQGQLRGHIGVFSRDGMGLRGVHEVLESLFRTRTLDRKTALERIERRLEVWGQPREDDAERLLEFLRGRGEEERPESVSRIRGSIMSVFAMITRAMRAACNSRPRLIILEDLHWADAAVFAFFDYLAVELRYRPMPLLIVATLRPEELEEGSSGREGYDALKRHLEENLQRVCLDELDEQDAIDFFQALLPVEPRLAQLAYARSGGHPLHLTILARYLRAQELVRWREDHWEARDLEALGEIVPPDLGALFALRLEGVVARAGGGEHLQELLLRMAFIGLRFRYNVLTRSVELSQNEEIAESLDNDFELLLEEGLIIEVMGRGEDHYSFNHGMFRDFLIRDRCPRRRRAELHRQTALALESCYPNPSASISSEIAGHWESAADLGRAIRFHQRAAQRALRAYALRHAASAFEQIIALSDRLLGIESPADLPKLTDRERFEAVALEPLDYLEALWRQGDLREGFGEFERSERAYRRCVRLVGKPNITTPGWAIEPLGRAWLGLGHIAWQRGEFEAADWAFARVMQLADAESPALQVLNAAQRGLARVAWHRGEYDRARKLGAHALKEARRHDLAVGEAESLWLLGEVSRMLGDVERAQEYYQTSLRIHAEQNHPTVLARNELSMAQLARVREDLEQAQLRYEAALSHYERLGDRRGMAQAINGLGEVARFGGDLERASDHYERALTIYLGMGAQYDAATVYANLGLLATEQGELAGAENLLQAALRMVLAQEDYPYLQAGIEYNLALVKALRGDHAGSEELLREVLELNRRVPIAELDFAKPLERLGQLHAEQGSAREADVLWERAAAIYADLGMEEERARVERAREEID